MRWLLNSAMYRVVPAALTVTPVGLLNKAAVPVPSKKDATVPPALPPPATVVVTPVAATTWRTRLLPASATKMTSPAAAEKAMFCGLVNLAAWPVAST